MNCVELDQPSHQYTRTPAWNAHCGCPQTRRSSVFSEQRCESPVQVSQSGMQTATSACGQIQFLRSVDMFYRWRRCAVSQHPHLLCGALCYVSRPWPKQALEALPSLYISGPWTCTITPAGNAQHQARGGQWPVSMRSFKTAMRSFKTAMSKQSMLQAKALLRGNELGLGAGHRTYWLVASALASCSRPNAQALSSSGPRPPRKMYNIGTPRYISATAPRICNYPHLGTGRVIVHYLGGGLLRCKS